MASFFSLISLYTAYLRRCFTSSGLSRQSIAVDDDTTLHFWAPIKPTSQKPSLVLIHGFGPISLYQWRRQVQFFAPDFNLYVPDLVFFGDSTTKSAGRSEVFQAESVAKLLEALGVERYSVVGTSYGGLVGYHVARLRPERVERVVIASSGVNMRKRDNEALVKKGKAECVGDLMLPQTPSQLRALMDVAVHRRVRMVPDFFLNDFIRKLYGDRRNEKLELLDGLIIAQDDSVNISPLKQNVILVWGEHDQIFPLEMAYELKGLIGEKDVKLEIIKNTSHVPQIEDSEAFNNIVKTFLTPSS